MDKKEIITKLRKRLSGNLLLPGILLGFFALFVAVLGFVLQQDDEVIIPFVIFCIIESIVLFVFIAMVCNIIKKLNIVRHGQEGVAEYISHRSNMSVNDVTYYHVRYKYCVGGETVVAKTGSYYKSEEAEALRSKHNLKIMYIGKASVLVDEGVFVRAATVVEGEDDSALFGRKPLRTVSAHVSGDSNEELFAQMLKHIEQADSRSQMESIIERHRVALPPEVYDRLNKRINYICRQRGYNAQSAPVPAPVSAPAPAVVPAPTKEKASDKAAAVAKIAGILAAKENEVRTESARQPEPAAKESPARPAPRTEFSRSFGGFDKPDYSKPDFAKKTESAESRGTEDDGEAKEGEKKEKNKWDSFYE